MVYWDLTTPGFGVMVSTKTGVKTYVAQRDMPNGKTRRVTIGLVGEIATLDEARDLAGDKIHAMRQGIDPKAARGLPTLEQAMEAYIGSHANLAKKSQAGYRRALGYLSDWRASRLSDITTEMVRARHKELGTEYGEATANATMRALRAWFNEAIETYPEMTANPVRLKRKWFDVPRREGHVSADKLPEFYDAVLKLENLVQRDYLLLLLFTGLRREEAASLSWTDVDFTAKVIRLPALRTKAKRRLDLPMSDFVLGLLGGAGATVGDHAVGDVVRRPTATTRHAAQHPART